MIMMADKLIGTPEGETNPTEEEKAWPGLVGAWTFRRVQ